MSRTSSPSHPQILAEQIIDYPSGYEYALNDYLENSRTDEIVAWNWEKKKNLRSHSCDLFEPHLGVSNISHGVVRRQV